MADQYDASWTRALMASSGIAWSATDKSGHMPEQWHEASAEGTPLARLQQLATHKHPDVRAAVARRPDCPIGLLATLAHDRSHDVRCAVASSPRMVLAVAQLLVRDKDSTVLKSLARNDALPLAILQELALSRREDVRHVASRRLDARVHGGDALHLHPDARRELFGSQEQPRELPAELRDRVQPTPPPDAFRPHRLA